MHGHPGREEAVPRGEREFRRHDRVPGLIGLGRLTRAADTPVRATASASATALNPRPRPEYALSHSCFIDEPILHVFDQRQR